MEVRCASCNKLFRVSDDKIIGSGVKFPCTRCGEYVKITKEDYEQYRSKSAAVPPVIQPEPAAPAAAAGPASAPAGQTFDFGALEAAPASPETETPPAFVKPAPSEPVKPAAEARKEPPAEPKPAPAPKAPAAKPAPAPKPEPVRAAASPAPRPAAHPAPPREPQPAAESAAPSGGGKKTLVIIALFLVIAGGVAYGVKTYLARSARRTSEAVKQLTSPDGLQISNATGAMDPATGDLVISGVVENATDKPRPAWYVVAEVYDAQGNVLVKAKLLNGKQLYTKRDYDILAKRGVNVQELRMKQVQEQGVTIPAKGTTNFAIRVMEPPVGVASFNATLQPFDPVQLFKEMVAEQKQQ